MAIALTIFSIGTYLVWPNRWNVPAHIQLGFVVSAYLVPIFCTDYLADYPPWLIEFYALIVTVGAISFIVGLFWGARLPRIHLTRLRFSFESLTEAQLLQFVSRRAIWLGLFAVAGMIISFAVMGFVPMLAEDPMMAKYLRGRYHEDYKQIEVLFRSSEQILQVVMPITLVLAYVTRRARFALLFIAEALVEALTLSRALLGFSIVVGLGVIVVNRGRRAAAGFLVFMVISTAAMSAAAYYTLPLLLPQTVALEDSTVWEHIADGTPDVTDNLSFLANFLEEPRWTYGRTFFGALIPHQYPWNPFLWTLRVQAADMEADLSNAASGGLRLPAPVYGYTAFGWLGVILVCWLRGVFAGYGAVFGRQNLGEGSLLKSIIVVTVWQTAITQLIEFYFVSFYGLFPICVMLIFLYRFRFRSRPTVLSAPELGLGTTFELGD